MTKSSSVERLIGFLTVVEPCEGVLIGGYLMLNPKGRPIEFHCTAPVQPNRAQQILYGASLRPYLCGERIAQALVTQSKREPEILCTDIADAMDLREHVATPVILMSPEDSEPSNNVHTEQNGAFVTISLGTETALVHPGDIERRHAIEKSWEPFASVCLSEPFGRIREAVREAQRDAAA